MCGIVGQVVMSGRRPDEAGVQSGCSVLQHRGPDGHGVVSLSQACLGHTRLSIIDLVGGKQPVTSDCGRYSLVFNGEIYNYRELRQELRHAGHPFKTEGDTEVLLATYIAWGADCLQHLNGMFAFAIWDNIEKALFMARDRLGKKPLYYALGKHSLNFGSEIKALKPFAEIDWTVNRAAVDDFFAHQYCLGENTIYQAVKRLPAGHWLRYQAGKIKLQRYWNLPRPCQNERSADEYCDMLGELLLDAVRLRLRSDVPLGAFLSGGVDSALVVAMMREAGADIETYTVGFSESSFDERVDARKTAEYYSTQHHEICLDPETPDAIRGILDYFDEPFGDPSAIPTAMLCAFARGGVTVALSGDGVDEFFGGYRRYQARQLLEKLNFLPRSLRLDMPERLIRLLPERTGYYGNSKLKQLNLALRLMRQTEESPANPLPHIFLPSERRALFHGTEVELQHTDIVSEMTIADYAPVEQMMLADQEYYLRDDILVKVDRMSMMNSLEVRSPFLDHRLVEFIGGLPCNQKLRHGVQKYLLRKCYQDRLPRQVLERRKHGFSVPLGDWFRGQLKTAFEDMVLSGPGNAYLNQAEIKRLWSEHGSGRADHGFKLWLLFVFCNWLESALTPT